MAGITVICCVVNNGDASKLMKFASKYEIQGATVSIGRGSVNNRLLKFLQLDEVRKEIVNMIVDSSIATKVLQGISEYMEFEKQNHGIAFSHAVSGVSVKGKRYDSIDSDNTKLSEVSDTMYNAIHVIVEKGNAEDVIEAAKAAGARGATIVNARGSGAEEAKKFFSLEIEPEKEKIFIIAKVELKDAIVEAINQHLEIEKPGKGIVYVLDVKEAYGLQ